jgi:acyl-coenzyme A thioesterase PaaI-like protein
MRLRFRFIILDPDLENAHQPMNDRLQRLKMRFINFYPPLLGAGIRSRLVDPYTYRVEMKLTAFNNGLFDCHFGGSLYAMCDPWFALILIAHLGTDFIVWDKAASIQFIRPGRSNVSAIFNIPPARVAEIRKAADANQKTEPTFVVDILDNQAQVVAHVEKLVYVRKKNRPA